MKLGIPTLDKKGWKDKVGEHFGRVPTYTLVDLEKDEIEVIPNTSHHKGGEGNPPEILKDNGVDTMICKALGRKAIRLFNQMGINVYIGASETVEEAIQDFKKGKLREASSEDACRQHVFRGKGRHTE